MKIGITCGTFDLLHAGHILFLRDCKMYCDRLMVCLHTNPAIENSKKNKPIQTLDERQIQLSGCKYVDHIIIYDTEEELSILLEELTWDIRFLGSDYEFFPKEKITGFDLGIIKYIDRNHSWSTTELRNRIKDL